MRRRFAAAAAAAGILAAAGVVAVVLARGDAAPDRPELQRRLDALVAGDSPAAPGATAWVRGPGGTWAGAAGLADVAAREPMRPGARLRLESVSKLWTAVVALRLEEEGRVRLDDPVERHLPGLLPDGGRITLRHLLSHTSGLVDDNDFNEDPGSYVARVRDPGLRAELRAAGRRLAAHPEYEFPTELVIRWGAALPLLSEPGSAYRYSNIGYMVAGRLLERASGETFAELVERLVAGPLGLDSASYDPRSAIAGPHARGYAVDPGPVFTDRTGVVSALGPQGGIVASAADEGRFLAALFGGRLLGPTALAALKTPPAGGGYGLGTGVVDSGCAGTAYAHNGAGAGFTTSVIASGDGSRVAVVLLNGRTGDGYGDELARGIARQLFCAA